MVVLDKVRGQSQALKLVSAKGFEEESPVVLKSGGLNDDNPVKFPTNNFERHSARNLSLSTIDYPVKFARTDIALRCDKHYASQVFMKRIDYETFVQNLMGQHSHPVAMELAVGGEFANMGFLQRELLIASGLKPDSFLIDVGCGSGRLASQLTNYLPDNGYLGIDVVPELLEYAREKYSRPGWRFEVANGFTLPATDGLADMVCFFSVFTHLRHEESFLYLRDTKRALKPGGKAVLSFVEFLIPSHWHVFEVDVANMNANVPPNQFLSRDALHAWAHHLGFAVEAIYDGDKPHIPLSQPVTLSSGTTFTDKGYMGQSICVLRSEG